MPNPQPSDLHVSTALTDYSNQIVQDVDDFKASDIFPFKDSDKKNNTFHVYTSGDWFRDDAEERVYPGEAAGTFYNTTTATFSCKVFAVRVDVTEDQVENADDVFDLEEDASQLVTMKLLLREEVRWAAAYFATSIWDTDLTGGGGDFVSWNNASAVWIADILENRTTMKGATGKYPQVLVMSDPVYNAVRLSAQVTAQLRPTDPAVATLDVLARLADLEQVIKTTAVQNSANEGIATSNAFIHGNSALLVHRARTVGKKTATAGLTHRWTGLSGAGEAGIRIKTFPIEEKGVLSRVEGNVATDINLISSELGIFFSTPLA